MEDTDGGADAEVAGSLLILARVIVGIGGAVFSGATRGVTGVAVIRAAATRARGRAGKRWRHPASVGP
ncbi:MAG: hypothetical protein JO287_11270 [Pseudonocardiales bacterium]|nr:hypothetical protein [Pseudonocardiales bacterium]